MKKLIVDQDNWYCWYIVPNSYLESTWYNTINVSDEDHERIVAAFKEFEAVQELIRNNINK